MTKKDYAGLAANILMLVGGAENISFCEHCMTRLRFNVKDRSLVRDEELNELDGTNFDIRFGCHEDEHPAGLSSCYLRRPDR